MKKLNRTIAITLLCCSLLTESTQTKQETYVLETNLTENISQHANKKFDGVCYFSSYTFGEANRISVVGYNNTWLLSSEEEKYSKFVKLDYDVSASDFEDLQILSGSFEDIAPFNKQVLEKLVYITENYEPTNVYNAHFTDAGEQILTEIIEKYEPCEILSTNYKGEHREKLDNIIEEYCK